MAEPSFLRRVWDWLVLPRPLQLSPLAAAAMVAVIVTTTLFIRPKGSGRGAPAPSDTSGMVTRFVFLAPHASRVAVTGDFANWDPEGIPLRRQGGGGWAAELNLPPGLYHYVFVIDGTEWHADPNASSSVDNGFGQRNSVLVVPLIRTN